MPVPSTCYRCHWHVTSVPPEYQGMEFLDPNCYVCRKKLADGKVAENAPTPAQLVQQLGHKRNKPKYNFRADRAAHMASLAPIGLRRDFR